MKQQFKSKRYFAAAVLPNLITMLNLFSGFLSIMMTLREQYFLAVWFILLGLVWDSLDGHVARVFHNPTEFGKELDSLCDIVSFVVAPCVFTVVVIFLKMSPWVLFAVFIYLSAGAYRLARFNIRPCTRESFEGLPTPAAAVTLSASVLACYQNQWAPNLICHIGIASLMIYLSLMMVGEVPYPKLSAVSFKSWFSLFALQAAFFFSVTYFLNIFSGFASIFLLFLFLAPIYTRRPKENKSIEL